MPASACSASPLPQLSMSRTNPWSKTSSFIVSLLPCLRVPLEKSGPPVQAAPRSIGEPSLSPHTSGLPHPANSGAVPTERPWRHQAISPRAWTGTSRCSRGGPSCTDHHSKVFPWKTKRVAATVPPPFVSFPLAILQGAAGSAIGRLSLPSPGPHPG